MEHAKGGELFNYIINKRRLNEQEASYFFYQIINGMEYLHKKNIVHRDLKPENLLLTEEKIIKIIDFGLSNEFSHGNLLKTPCGSPCYAAPEMVLGKKYSGIKIDIWSTGIILYAMTCGYLPFEDKKNEILFKKIIDCDYEFPNFLSTNVKDIIKKILVTNPRDRATIEDIKKHSFYNQGKIIFYKEQKFCLENIVNNKEIEILINQKIVSELNKKLNEKLTMNDIEDLRVIKNKKYEKKINNKVLNNSDFLYNNEDVLNNGKYYLNEEEDFEVNKKKSREEDKNIHNNYEKFNETVSNKNIKWNGKQLPDNSLKQENANSKLFVSYDILYNNTLKDKNFLKNILSKIPKEACENTALDRESRRSKSITTNQGCFGQPKINININCIKKIENVNFNIVPIVSISSVPYTSKTGKNKIDIANFKNAEKNNINNKTINSNSTNTNSNINNNLSKFYKKEKNKKSFSSFTTSSHINNNLNSKENQNNNNNNHNLNYLHSNGNCSSTNTQTLNNLVSLENNHFLNNINSNYISHTISQNNYSSKNKLIKQKTVAVTKLNNKNLEKTNHTIDAKSMYSQFKDCKVSFANKAYKHISTLKKNNFANCLNQFPSNDKINKEIITKQKHNSLIQDIKSDRTGNTKTNKTGSINLIEMRSLDFGVANKKRYHSIRVETPSKIELSNSVRDNVFKKSNFNNAKSISNVQNNNSNYLKNTIGISKNINNVGNKQIEEININSKDVNNDNYSGNNNISTNFNISNNKTINVKMNSNNNINNNVINNLYCSTNNTINAKSNHSNNFNNIYTSNINNNKLNLHSSESKTSKSPRRHESLKVTEVKKIQNFRENAPNTVKKVLASDKKAITSSDRIFSENSIANKNFEKKGQFNTNRGNSSNRNSSDTLKIKNNINNKLYNPNNNFSNNNSVYKTMHSEKFDLDLKTDITNGDSKLKRLRRIIKDSLGSSGYAFDLSCMQRLDSPNKKNTISVSNINNEKNDFKVPLGNNNTISSRNNLQKNPIGNNSSRFIDVKNSNGFSKSRPSSKQVSKRNYSQKYQNSAFGGDYSNNVNNRTKDLQKDFENFYKKVNENFKSSSNNTDKNYNRNLENLKDYEAYNDNEFLKNQYYNQVNTIDIDLNEDIPFKGNNTDKYSKFDFKYKRDKLPNNYVTLDLFDMKKSNGNNNFARKHEKSQNQLTSRAKNHENAFKIYHNNNKEKVVLNENINYNFTKNNNYPSYGPKLSLKSNSISKSKVSLSSKTTLNSKK